jgi:oligopeptide/dipeptide ABC transporter ATP-binding protein
MTSTLVSPTTLRDPVLVVDGLTVTHRGRRAATLLCDRVSLSVRPGEIVGLVGESGSGKSLTSMAILGLLPSGVSVTEGSIRLDGEELVGAVPRRMQQVRGDRIAYIAQDATASLNPVLRVGTQIVESLRTHLGLTREEARSRAVELLDDVGIPDPAARLQAFPHELSGGMRQRVVIAIALACDPDVIIADEPTTALDVTIQAQIIKLIASLARDRDLGVLLISHDLGVVSGVTDRTLVMYSGRIVEVVRSADLLASARHPYTRALLEATPRLSGARRERFTTIPGRPPHPAERPSGCAFHPRCPRATERCRTELPSTKDGGVACWHPHGRAYAAASPAASPRDVGV